MDVKKTLVDVLNTDTNGWVTNEAFDETRKLEMAMFARLSKTVAQDPDADMTVEDLRRMWPFDKPALDCLSDTVSSGETLSREQSQE